MAGLILKSGLFAKIAAAPMASDRSLTREQLAEIWDGRAELYDSPEEGFCALNREKGPEDMVYAAGSCIWRDSFSPAEKTIDRMILEDYREC